VQTARFTVAVNRSYKNDKGEYEADFIPVVAWRKLAELCSQYVHKGSLVAVQGEIRTRSYEKDGIKHYVTEVLANTVKFLDSKKKEAGNIENDDINLDAGFEDFVPVDVDEDLPF
jgi:single-strand DNA-binding protein